MYLPNSEMTLDLEVNEVEVKVLTSLASVTWSTGTKGQAFQSLATRSIRNPLIALESSVALLV